MVMAVLTQGQACQAAARADMDIETVRQRNRKHVLVSQWSSLGKDFANTGLMAIICGVILVSAEVEVAAVLLVSSLPPRRSTPWNAKHGVKTKARSAPAC